MQNNERKDKKILDMAEHRRGNDEWIRPRTTSPQNGLVRLGPTLQKISRDRDVWDNKPRTEFTPQESPLWICATCRMETDGKTYHGYRRSPRGKIEACPECSPVVKRLNRRKNIDKYISEMVRNGKFCNGQNLSIEAPRLTLDRYPALGDQTAKTSVQDFINGDFNEILLTGSVGRGKTGLAIAAVNELQSTGIQVLFLPINHYIKLLQESFRSEYESHVRDIANGVEVLVADDLGTERITESGFSVEELQSLIDERHSRGLRTLITTNMSIPGLTAYWYMERYAKTGFQPGERLASRLEGWYKLVNVAGPDLRR